MIKFYFFIYICFLYTVSYSQTVARMVTVEGGTFEMGSNDGEANAKPVHTVTVSSFRMCIYPVTVAQFAEFVNATGYKTDAEKKGTSCIFAGDKIEWHWMNKISWRDDELGHPRKESEWNMPVIHVSWSDAIAYCKWLSKATGINYRLPTEAEREYAAGNGSKHTRFSWGNEMPGADMYVGNVRDETTSARYGSLPNPRFAGYNDGYYFCSPVGCYAPNDFGLYDMTGNVWEWVNDKYDGKYYSVSPSKDPQGPPGGRMHVFRGGSWHSAPSHCWVTYRYSGSEDNRTPNLGFRLATSL